VADFYSHGGWATVDGVTEDARRFEDLRESAEDYVSVCRLRVLRHIPDGGPTFWTWPPGQCNILSTSSTPEISRNDTVSIYPSRHSQRRKGDLAIRVFICMAVFLTLSLMTTFLIAQSVFTQSITAQRALKRKQSVS